MRILGTRGSRYLGSLGPPIFDRGLPSALRPRSPSMTIAANERQTSQGVSMNVPRKWRYLVIAAAVSLAWALSAGLPAVHAAGPATSPGALVSVGSPTNIAPRNAQNE